MVKPIKMKNIEDIEQVNRIISKYPFDVWIHGKSGMADAKSILGLFILKLDEPLTIVVPDEANTSKLFEELSEYMNFY
jgi:phosphotransferase system HPr-like phosphotransfer protein